MAHSYTPWTERSHPQGLDSSNAGWLSLARSDTLNNRQNCVHEFVQAPGLATDLQNTLKQIRDIERILGRLQNRIQNPRELGGIRDSLHRLPNIKALLAEFPDSPIEPLALQIDTFDSLSTRLANGLADELPSKLDEGGTIRNGFDSQLDELRTLKLF